MYSIIFGSILLIGFIFVFFKPELLLNKVEREIYESTYNSKYKNLETLDGINIQEFIDFNLYIIPISKNNLKKVYFIKPEVTKIGNKTTVTYTFPKDENVVILNFYYRKDIIVGFMASEANILLINEDYEVNLSAL